jgi:ADP-ribose pyrophosphatase YjhB (NUDIX family)/aminoglycoside phosphotransferase (APT) family kinase protein
MESDDNERRVRLAAFALPLHQGRVLLARHTYGLPMWAMVGGLATLGETVEEAVRREVGEETGLAVSPGDLLAFADRADLSLYVFAAQPLGPVGDVRPQEDEIAELAWFGLEDLLGRTDVFELARLLALRQIQGTGGGPWRRRAFEWPDGESVPVYYSAAGPTRLAPVLSPPEELAFRELTGIGEQNLEVETGGWAKLAILGEDRAFLFPRHGREAGLFRGARACEFLSLSGVGVAPAVLGQWSDQLAAGPFVAFERRQGRPWTELEETAGRDEVRRLMTSLGEAIARWHSIAPELLPPELRSSPPIDPKPELDELVGLSGVSPTMMAAGLLRPDEATLALWAAAASSVAAMDHVFVHGDICENQLLVDDQLAVGTVLDWDTCGVGHPLYDLDFGEWGLPLYRWEADFPLLRKALWQGYAKLRGQASLPRVEEVELVFALAEVVALENRRSHGGLDRWAESRIPLRHQALLEATEALKVLKPIGGRR